MALKFYDGNDKHLSGDFAKYMNNAPSWNDSAVIGDPVSVYATQRNNEKDITEILLAPASRFSMGEVVYDNPGIGQKVTLAQAIKDTGHTVVVLKGIHQKSDPHITVAYDMNIWHLCVRPLGSDQTNFSVYKMSKGADYEQMGWKKG